MDMGNLNLPRGLLGEHVELGTFPQTVSLVSRLLASFSPKLEAHRQTRRRDLVLRHNFSWVLNGYHRLRKIIFKWLHSSGAKATQEEEQVLLQYLTYLRECCVSEPHSTDLLLGVSLTSVGSQCLAEFLKLDNLHQLPALQVELGYFLDDLTQPTKRFESSAQQMRDILSPAFAEVRNKDASLQSFEASLQVFTKPHALKT